jgi:hypothetical protein
MANKMDLKMGIDLAAINIEIVDAYLTKLGISTDGVEYSRITRLHEVMQLVPSKGNKLGNCSTCRGKSHVDLSCCPFCGDGEADETILSQRLPGEDPEVKVIAELITLIGKQTIANEKAAADKAAKERPAVTAPSPVAGQPALVPVPPGARSKRAARQNGEQTTIATADGAALNAPATVEDLDKASAQIYMHLNEAARSVYDAAVVVFHVFEAKLWMQRRKENGDPKYETFTAWVLEEMPFTPAYAYELTNLPKFFTREQAEKIGSTKLTLSLRISDEERRKLLESGDLEKMSVRDVKDRISQNPATQPKNGGNAQTVVGGKLTLPGGKRGPKPKKQSSAKGLDMVQSTGNHVPANGTPVVQGREPEPLTIVTCVLPTRVEFDMMARPPQNKSGVPNPPVRAKDLSDDPFATITCANGAKMRIVLYRDGEGFLKGVLYADSSVLTHAKNDSDDEQDVEE